MAAEGPCLADLAVEAASREALRERFHSVRQASESMCRPLRAEDYRIQPVPEVSPPWWNLGHTSWFFARNVLLPLGGEYTADDERLDYVLNSYYASLGSRLARNRRGLMTRPTTDEVYQYRRSVDARVLRLIESIADSRLAELAWLLTTGMQHEQQHQELFYTEIKYILAEAPPPLRAVYRERTESDVESPASHAATILGFDGGLYEFGNLEGGWCWDNELPVHKYYLTDFALSSRLVTCGEYAEFIADGGYDNQLLWLDNGWSWKCQQGWSAPLYWERSGESWSQWTLNGMSAVSAAEPVCHVSFYEAEAFARWKGETFSEHRSARLPSEREWEHAVRSLGQDPHTGNQLRADHLHPIPALADSRIAQLFGDAWEWTASYYEPYPGYRPFAGALTEYNSKFMDNQRVLRGGSCVTPPGHMRRSYRNFWSGETRFQFTGLRLAYDEAP
ncbi:MAG: ergothioneine biosynthesis protein EgtB [Planctomycetota bacterium]